MDQIEIAQEMLLEALIHKFDSIPKHIENRIKSIQNKDIFKSLLRQILICQNIEDVKASLYNVQTLSGKKGLDFQQNYDAVVKWLAQEFKGKTLEIFGVKTMPIIDVFNFEPVEITIHTGRFDLMFRDQRGALYHLEEQRNMAEHDLYRFGVYHFQAVRQWGKNITDIILISGRNYNSDKVIETGSGRYSPKLIDLTEKHGQKRLKEIREEVKSGKYSNLIELVFVPLYGKENDYDRSKLAVEVLNYEVELLKKDKFMDKLVIATIIMSNKIVDKQLLKQFYEEVKNMLDILEIAREDGMEKGIERGMERGMLNATREMIFEALEEYFGVVPGYITEKVKSIPSQETLKNLFRQAVRSSTLNQFEEKLSQYA